MLHLRALKIRELRHVAIELRYRPYVCQGPREKQPLERLINFGYVRLKCEVQASSLCPGV